MYDGKGNVSALLDSSQNVAATYRYDAFGVLKEKTGTLNQLYQFSTKLYDPETGLSYYGFRYYSPSIGRWITRDPIGEAGGINLYQFNLNNPVNFVDPLGLTNNNSKPETIKLKTKPFSLKGTIGSVLMLAGGAAVVLVPSPYVKGVGFVVFGGGLRGGRVSLDRQKRIISDKLPVHAAACFCGRVLQ